MYSIRRAKREDAQDIHEAHMNSIREICSRDHTGQEISGWGHRPFNETQRIEAIEKNYVWVVEINNKVEGYAEIRFRQRDYFFTAHIFGLYLTTKAAGLGAGKKLLEYMLEVAKEKKVKQVTLESTITAHKFYQKFGFVDSAEQLEVQIGNSFVRCFPMKLDLFYSK